jgi:hypothetical protein
MSALVARPPSSAVHIAGVIASDGKKKPASVGGLNPYQGDMEETG